MKLFYFSYCFLLIGFPCQTLTFKNEDKKVLYTSTLFPSLESKAQDIGANDLVASLTEIKKDEQDSSIQNEYNFSTYISHSSQDINEKSSLIDETAQKSLNKVEHEKSNNATVSIIEKYQNVDESSRIDDFKKARNEINNIGEDHFDEKNVITAQNISDQNQMTNILHSRNLEAIIPMNDQVFVNEFTEVNEMNDFFRTFSDFTLIETTESIFDFSKSNTISPTLRESIEKQAVDPPEIVIFFFYLSHCAHCHRTAPMLIEASKALSCHRNVKFYAFACSDDKPGTSEHLDFCNNQNIQLYPHIRVYATYKKHSLILLYKNQKSLVTEQQRDEFINWISSTCSAGFYRGCSASESPNDLPFSDDIKVPTEPKLSTPVPETTENVISISTPTTELSSIPSADLYPHSSLSIANEESADKRYLYTLNCVYRLFKRDCLLGLSENDNIPRETLMTILDVLMMLRNLLPGNNIRVQFHNFELALLKKMSNTTIAVSEFKNLFNTYIESKRDFPLITHPFNAFFSDMWIFFHFMTISNQVLWQTRAEKNITSFAHPLTSQGYNSNEFSTNRLTYRYPVYPEKMCAIFKRVVSMFLPCESCRNHFASLSKLITFRSSSYDFQKVLVDNEFPDKPAVATSKNLALYFWRLHNLITRRIALEKIGAELYKSLGNQALNTSDTVLVNFAKAIEQLTDGLPYKHQCASCHISTNIKQSTPDEYFKLLINEDVRGYNFSSQSSKELDLLSDNFRNFDLSKTFQFLVKYYWNTNWFADNVLLKWNDDQQAFDILYFNKTKSALRSINVAKIVVNQNSSTNNESQNNIVIDDSTNSNRTAALKVNMISENGREIITSNPNISNGTSTLLISVVSKNTNDIASLPSPSQLDASKSTNNRRIRYAFSTQLLDLNSHNVGNDSNTVYYPKPNPYQTITLASSQFPQYNGTPSDQPVLVQISDKYEVLNATSQANNSYSDPLSSIFFLYKNDTDVFFNTPFSNEKIFTLTKYLILISFIILAFLIVISVCHRTW
jgi:thiol-disulfide isomerase/thioredoxin